MLANHYCDPLFLTTLYFSFMMVFVIHANQIRTLKKDKYRLKLNRFSSYLRIQLQFSWFILYFSLCRRHSIRCVEEYEVSAEVKEFPVVCVAVRLRSCPLVVGSSTATTIDNITWSI